MNRSRRYGQRFLCKTIQTQSQTPKQEDFFHNQFFANRQQRDLLSMPYQEKWFTEAGKTVMAVKIREVC